MRIRVIDAFTDRPFAGNPAAVCLLDGPDWPAAEWMQQVAAEMNLSETAFAKPLPPGGEADRGLRWFTPVAEVRLCGHATLATTHALHADGLLDGGVRYATRAGVLGAVVEPDGAITLDFPAAPVTQIPVPDGVPAALGRSVVAAYGTGDLGDLLLELADADAVLATDPDMAAVARIDCRGVIVTAASRAMDTAAGRAMDTAAGTAEGREHDFVSRFFAPGSGVAEDPVTGSAHTALAPFWSARLRRPDLVGWQASGRGGVVRTRVAGDRVLLTGGAVTVLDGTLLTTG